MAIARSCVLLFCGTAAAYRIVPRIPPAAAIVTSRCAVHHPVMSEGGGDLSANINPEDMDRLRKRIQNIQENGLATPAQKLFDMAMSKPPQVLMREFFRTGDPMVVQAMQDAVAALLGNLPPYEFDAQMTTTGDKLAALMLQLQMTGYLLRNAEYVMKLRQILQIKSRSMVSDDIPKCLHLATPPPSAVCIHMHMRNNMATCTCTCTCAYKCAYALTI